MKTYTEEEIKCAKNTLLSFYKIKHSGPEVNVFLHKNKDIIDIVNYNSPICIKNYALQTKLYWFMHNIKTFPLCSICKKPILREVINSVVGYTVQNDKINLYCCHNCQKKSQHYIDAQRNAIIKKFGKINNIKNEYPLYAKNKTLYSKRKHIYEKICKNEYTVPLITLENFYNIKNLKTTQILWHCKECNKEFYSIYTKYNSYILNKCKKLVHARCPFCYPRCNTASFTEKQIVKYLKEKYYNFIILNNKIENWQLINPYQIDIIIKQHDKTVLCIEYNGVRWHSLQMKNNINQQLNKTLLCEKLGIPLIHIYEDEWQNLVKQQKIKTLISLILNNKDLMFKDKIIILPRDKFPKTTVLKNYVLIKEIPPKIIKRYSNYQKTEQYDVPNAGYLVYKKL